MIDRPCPGELQTSQRAGVRIQKLERIRSQWSIWHLRVAALAALVLPMAVLAQSATKLPAKHTVLTDQQLTLDIADLCPRFLDFYEAAQAAAPARRWQLWNEKYGFAAVPPTPSGAELAHKMLDSAWPRYAKILPLVRQGAAALGPEPLTALRQVADLFALREPLEMQLVVYVGEFDGNAFTSVQQGKPVVAVPIEMGAGDRELALRHEMTHAVEIKTAGLSGGWERSIAQTIFQEGLAMRATQALMPGRVSSEYVHEFEPGWYAHAMVKARAILRGIQPMLARKDSAAVERFTMGQGTTGTTREAYVAGWLVFGELLRQGKTLPQLARVPSSQMTSLVNDAIGRLLRMSERDLQDRE